MMLNALIQYKEKRDQRCSAFKMKNPSVEVRRKPRQSRAKYTQQALIESFVRLLEPHSATDITIREITELAGVGLGTFYEYFSRKEDLIALSIHQQIKAISLSIEKHSQAATMLNPHISIDEWIKKMIQHQIDQIQIQQKLWSEVFRLERQVSTIDAYRKHYEIMLNAWRNSLRSRFDNEHYHNQALALNIHRISYSFISQALLIDPYFNQWYQLELDIVSAIQAFITH